MKRANHGQLRPPGHPAPIRAFTLIELLAAVALVILLMLVVVQILNNTGAVTNASRRHINADAEARSVFDRMALDFGRMVKRSDVDYLMNKLSGNDEMFFFSEAPAFSTISTAQQNSVALVGYRVNSSFQLERLGKGLSWNGASSDGVVFLTYASYPVSTASTPLAPSTLAGAFPAVASGSADASFHELGPSVFRCELSFLLKPFTKPDGTVEPGLYSNVPYDSRAGHSSLNLVGMGDVQAIVVTLAIIDEGGRKLIPVGGDLSAAVSALPDATLSPTQQEPPGKEWQGLIEDGTFFQNSGIPQAASKHVRIYQRIFPLNKP